MYRPWRPAGACAALLCAASVVAGPARADPAPAFPDLLREARASSPLLAEQDARVRAALGRAEQAGVRPNPVVSVDVENLGGSRSLQAIAPSQTTVSASQVLELGGQRRARIEAGDAEIRAARAAQSGAAADFAFELLDAYVSAEAAQGRVESLAGDLERARSDLDAARALVEAGREAGLRTVQAEAALNAARATVESAKADLVEALARLSVLSGAPAVFTSIQPSLLARAQQLPPPQGPAPASTPAILAAEAERDAASRRVNVERARAVPNVTLSVGARRIEGAGSTAVVGGISAPFPLFDRNRGSISAALAERDAAEARLRMARLEAEAGWRGGLSRAGAADAALRAAVGGEAGAAEAYRLSRVAYEAGRAPLIEVLNARRALTESQLRTLEARAQRIRSEAALARLAGRTPFGDAP